MADLVAVPQVIFTNPTVVLVGLTCIAAQRGERAGRKVIALAAIRGAKLHTSGYRWMAATNSRPRVWRIRIAGRDSCWTRSDGSAPCIDSSDCG
jgi:hypothetical protein